MSRKNISLHDEIEARALAVIKARGFAGLSDMVAVLIREDYERQGLGRMELKDSRQPPPPKNVPALKSLESYSPKPRQRKLISSALQIVKKQVARQDRRAKHPLQGISGGAGH